MSGNFWGSAFKSSIVEQLWGEGGGCYAIDDSTDVKYLFFIWGVKEDFEIVEKLLELVPMKGEKKHVITIFFLNL
jgi:hypothetical protein